MGKKKISKQRVQHITQQRIRTLFHLATIQMEQGNVHLANRYITHARNLSMKNVTAIPTELKHQMCRHCYAFLYPSVTCRIRVHRGKIIKYCMNCNRITRFPYK